MNNRFRTLIFAIPAFLIAVLLFTTSVVEAQQLLQYDQIPQVDEPNPLPNSGKQAAGEDPAAGQTPASDSIAQEDGPSSADSPSITATPHPVVSPRDLSNEMNQIEVTPPPEPWIMIMSEGFEGAFPAAGWTVFDGNGATIEEYYWDDDDYRPAAGGWSAWVANGGLNGLDPQFYDYPNDMSSWMVYGPFDLSDAVDAELLFYYWLKSEPGFDDFSWVVSIDNSYYYGYYTSGDSGGWVAENFDLTSVPTLGDVTGQSSVWIAFVFQSDSSVTDEGVYVDEILLQKVTGDPNLATIIPSGWDYPIVPSSFTGTHTLGSLFTYQNTYIDLAVANTGPVDVTDSFHTCLYFDGSEIERWYTPSLASGEQILWSDLILNLTPTPGWHNLTIVVDVNDDILEPNELDNTWSMDFYWHPDANLTPYKPGSWDSPLVPSSVTGTHTVNDLYTYQNTYVDWTIKNWGPEDILAQFDTCLYIDDVEINCWYTNGKIAGNIASVEDWVLNMTPTPGWHNLKIVTDVNDDVAESDETDNTWAADFYWHPEANLAPYKPGSWSAPIVPSTLTGTNIVNDLYANMDTFIDWTVKNSGPEDILAQFQTCLYFDSVEIFCWYTNGKIAGNIAFVEDWVLNMTPSPGWHTLEIVTDVYDVVLETNELDNTWAAEFYWNPSPNPDIYTSPSSLTSQQAQDQEKTLKLEIHNYGSAPLEWEIVESPTGSCSAADIPWVSVSPYSGTTAQASVTSIDVIFDSTGLAIGTYQGILCISSNDPDESLIAMLIELETIEELTIFLPMLMRP